MDIKSMMAQAKKMQVEIEKKQEQLFKKEFAVEKQGIKVVLFGNKKVKSVDINPALIDPDDKDIIESLIVIAINEGIDLIVEEEQQNSPSIPGMPF